MIIYDNRIPYTYLIGWSSLTQYYYGRRTAKNCDPSDLFVTYFTSSKYVKGLIEEYGLPDIIQIRKTFHGEDKIKNCIAWEEKVLRRMKASSHPKMINRSNAVNQFDSTGYVTVMRVSDEQTMQISVDTYHSQDPDNLLYKSVITGTVVCKVEKTFRRISSNEYNAKKEKYRHSCKDTIWVKDKTSWTEKRIPIDEFHKNRELYEHHSDGRPLTTEQVESLRKLHSGKPKTDAHKRKISKALKKYTRTEKHKENLKASRKKAAAKTYKQVVVNGVTYESISAAAKVYGITVGRICNMLAGRKPIRSDFWELRRP